jgi:hypothetical protein
VDVRIEHDLATAFADDNIGETHRTPLQFTGGEISFDNAKFTGGKVFFVGAKFTGGGAFFGLGSLLRCAQLDTARANCCPAQASQALP